ncbi:MAG: hypothetical protein HOB84_13915 [Candidatus Marinimicrobia bacterium]|jgi:hypothetical protein|nr:hypothetical protein [Candidatus Neomarinimicrobiota bacterium]MBT4361749.1 hypothetical protein [Candidatus Neomarinimicrobiota bacterium]MBT4715859.1 hypothetical protein [Candidatus Neomarinimicrobiota bacterium]MBT4947800.1 hypothetical protein [Candidatus Neomarinimicrobiota bacterium]MBT5271287.1 hypothetical protein [Candidatus Neomarinimicrobiota bacterium]
MSKKRNRAIDWMKYAYEMVSIIIGVLIALGVDEWNEDRQNQERARTALINIQNEAKMNLSILEVLHPRNMEAFAVVQTESSEDDSATIVPGLQLQDVAWKTLMSNGISVHVDYDELYQVAEIYSIQQIYKDFANQFVEQIMVTRSMSIVNGNPLSDSDIITASVELLTLLMGIEEQLQNHLTEFLDERSSEPAN